MVKPPNYNYGQRRDAPAIARRQPSSGGPTYNYGRWLIAGLYSLTGFPSRLREIRQLAVNFDNKMCSIRSPGGVGLLLPRWHPFEESL